MLVSPCLIYGFTACCCLYLLNVVFRVSFGFLVESLLEQSQSMFPRFLPMHLHRYRRIPTKRTSFDKDVYAKDVFAN